MFPLEHLLVAVVPVVGYVILAERRVPSARLLAVGFVGSQFPDLIDKPLAHTFQVLPSGRVFMHSLPFAIPLSALVLAYTHYTDRLRLGVVFVFAYVSHILADNYLALLSSPPQIPSDLFWPFTPPVPRPLIPNWGGAAAFNVRLWTIFSIVVVGIVCYEVIRDVTEQVGQRRVK